MLDELHNKEVHKWANDEKANGGQLISTERLFNAGDSLKGVAKGRSLAIITPSHLMRDIVKTKEYDDLINSPHIDKMTVNKGIFFPGIEKYQWYLPLTTRGATNAVNQNTNYISILQKFTGVVMYGMYVKDTVNPYILASPAEIKYAIKKCPNTKFIVWRHCWGSHLRSGTMSHRMCEFPNYQEWSPSKIPWAHCGAISGFAIPLAMTLGYSKIYLVCMGYDNVLNSQLDPKGTKIKGQTNTKVRGPWISNAPRRFKNQSSLARKNGIAIKVGPKDIVEKKLFFYYRSFGKISDIVNG